MNNTILYNGELVDASEFNIKTSNRSFKYGDGLFETIKVSSGLPLFYRSHHSRLVRGLHILGMQIPDEFSFLYFKNCLIDLIEQSGMQNGVVRVQAWRAGEGAYAPQISTFNWLAEIREAGQETFYQFENKAYKLAVYDRLKKYASGLSFFKSNNAQLYVLAAMFAPKAGADNAIILNQDGAVIETIAENIFLYKQGTVYTSPIADGAIDGIMRSVIKKLLAWNKIDFIEKTITVADVEQAEEIFLTNAIKGIIPVTEFQDKTYGIQFITGLQAKLNERVATILANPHKH